MNFYIKSHIVQKGETLEDIVSQYHILDVEMLRYFHNQNVPKNHNHIGSIISAGQEIFIPEKSDIEKIIAVQNSRKKELLEKRQEKLLNTCITFPFIKGKHCYNVTMQENEREDIHTFLLKIEYLSTVKDLHNLTITQSEIKANGDIQDSSVELFTSEINKVFYPIQVIISEKGLIEKVDKTFELQQNWNTYKSELYDFFEGKIGKLMLDRIEEKINDAEKLAYLLNFNIIWALVFRGITGEYQNGKCEKSINLMNKYSKFIVKNKIVKNSENRISKFHEIEQEIYDENNIEGAKIKAIYELDDDNILQKAEVFLFNMPKNLNIKITKTPMI